jgi:hypothetical protein
MQRPSAEQVRARDHIRKMSWWMPRMSRAVPYLGYLVVEATKARVASDAPVIG